jgi:Protein of unknown function (DUF5672)
VASPVAVVIPAHKPLDATEMFALRCNAAALADRDLFLLCPEHLDIGPFVDVAPALSPVRVADEHLATWRAHQALFSSANVYREFVDYRWMLSIHLDALVLDANALGPWLTSDYDYIGPPWFSRGRGLLRSDPVPRTSGISGVSLRNIESFLGVLSGERAPRRIPRLPDYGIYRNPRWRFSCVMRSPYSWAKVRSSAQTGAITEDDFWGFQVPRWIANWRKPTPNDSLRFAFHFFPRLSHRIVGSPPFAIHSRRSVETVRALLEGVPVASAPPDEFERDDFEAWSEILGVSSQSEPSTRAITERVKSLPAQP